MPETGVTANFHGVGHKTRQEREADAFALCSLIPQTSLTVLNPTDLTNDTDITPEMLAERFEIFKRYGI